jgi:hypothetical protein
MTSAASPGAWAGAPRTGIVTGPKIYFRFYPGSAGWPIGNPAERANMPANVQAQQRDLRRNYIGVVSNKFEEQCAGELQAKSDHRVRGYFLRLIAALRSHRAGPG